MPKTKVRKSRVRKSRVRKSLRTKRGGTRSIPNETKSKAEKSHSVRDPPKFLRSSSGNTVLEEIIQNPSYEKIAQYVKNMKALRRKYGHSRKYDTPPDTPDFTPPNNIESLESGVHNMNVNDTHQKATQP